MLIKLFSKNHFYLKLYLKATQNNFLKGDLYDL